MNDVSQRDAFDESASTYPSARPAYPPELYEDLIADTGIVPGSTALEIGAGPGTATIDLARRGFAITALELGPALADQARRQLADFPAVSVITTAFEEWQPPRGVSYPFAYAANSWHWLDRDTRWSKTAALLDDGGHLAVFGASHAFPEGFDQFFTEIQAVYTEIGEGTADWPPPPPRVGNADLVAEGLSSGLFGLAQQHLYVWSLDYDTDSYLALLSTFSNHIRMDPVKRDHLYAEVRRLISHRPDRRVTRHWQAQLTLFRREW